MTLAAPASAASGKVPLARSAWFFTSVANQVGAPAGPPVAEPTGVPQGDDAVAFSEDQTGASSKETLLQFSLPPGAASSTVTAFNFSISLDPSPTAPQAGARGAPIVACLPTRAWSSGEGQDSGSQPPVECSHAVAGVWKGDTVTFSIARLAQSWVDDVNLGIALVNDPKNKTQPFQAVFSGGKQVAATLGYQPATTSTTPTPPHHHGSSQHSAAHHHHFSVPNSGQGSTTPSIPSTSVPTGSSTTTISNGQAGGQPPVVANNNGSAAGATAAKAASQTASRDSSSVPPKGFWVSAAGVLILLVGAALALDDHRFVSPTTRRSRLDRLLRDPTRLATFTTRSQP
jgi:hypothetical protein